MSWYDYNWLLERAYAMIPPKVMEKKRFEIPKAKVVIEGNRTIILNFSEICDKINRDKNLVMKYLLKELATTGSILEKRLVLKGIFTPMRINEKIKKFVEEYVICHECGAPDTEIIREERVPMLRCLACGAKRPIKPIK